MKIETCIQVFIGQTDAECDSLSSYRSQKGGGEEHEEHEEGELDSSLEDTEHEITYHDDSDNEQNEDEHAEEELSQESTGGDKEKRGKKKKRRLSPIKLPASHYVLSEAEKRRERNIQDRERQYQE